MRRTVVLLPLVVAFVAAVLSVVRTVEGHWAWALFYLAVAAVMTGMSLTVRRWLRRLDAEQVAR